MNLGMIGMLGGIGQGMTTEAGRMYEDEKAATADTRARSLEEWRMNKRREFQLQDEQRAEDRAIRTDERNWKNEQDRAPVKREMKAEDVKAETRAKSDAAAATADQDASVKKKLTEAGQTDSARDLQGAQADYYRQRPTGNDKLSGADSEEAKSLREAINDKRKMIDQGRIDGTWDDSSLTPGQKKMQAELVLLEKRQKAMLEGARGGSGGGSSAPAAPKNDPLGLRKPAPGGAPAAAPRPGMDANNADNPAGIINQEYRQTKARLAAATDPAERKRLESDIAALQDEARRGGFALSDGPGGGTAPVSSMAGPLDLAKTKPPATAAPQPPAAAAPAGPTNTPKAALDNLLGGGSKPPAAAAGAPTGDYRSKVDALRSKLSGGAPVIGNPTSAPAADPLLQALGAGGGSSIDRIVGERAPALKQAADAIRAAQAEVVSAAKSQNPAMTQAATQKVSAAAAQLDQLLQGMNPAQAQSVKKALGVQ
jgi:hypothetical protein